MREKGILVIVSAPSGCGKSTVLRCLMQKRPKLHFSVSATTRQPRAGERDGVEYFFVTRERFMQMVEEDAFLEHAEFVGNHYGTPRAEVEQRLEDGYDVYLDIDVQGALQVRAKRPETLLIFILPPSMEELERRLISRGKDDMETIRRRLAEAARECSVKDRALAAAAGRGNDDQGSLSHRSPPLPQHGPQADSCGPRRWTAGSQTE